MNFNDYLWYSGWPHSRQCEIPWRFAALLHSTRHVKCYSDHACTSVTVSGVGRNATVYEPQTYIEALEHKGSISKNYNFSGNDKNWTASFNGWFYHLDMPTVKWFLHRWNCLHKFFLPVCVKLPKLYKIWLFWLKYTHRTSVHAACRAILHTLWAIKPSWSWAVWDRAFVHWNVTWYFAMIVV